MKVVIDSNIFIMCLNPASKYNSVFTELVKGSYTLAVSTDITFEYLEIFQQKFQHTKAEMMDRFLRESNHVTNTEIYNCWRLITIDPDDNKYVDCAIAANADYIVTNDKHLNVLNKLAFLRLNV